MQLRPYETMPAMQTNTSLFFLSKYYLTMLCCRGTGTSSRGTHQNSMRNRG